jgi:uncharacterized Zn finger protein (UPF0148 family)
MFKGVLFKENEQEIQEAVQRLKKFGNIPETCNFEHVCSPDLCNPRNDAWVPHVFVCVYGQAHVCLPGTCTLGVKTRQGEVVCPVSGLMLGVEESYTMKPEQQHWKRVSEKSTKKKDDVPSLIPAPGVLRSKCVAMLEKLLYGKERKRINDQMSAKQADYQQRQLSKELSQARRDRCFILQPRLEFIKSNTNVNGKIPYAILDEKVCREAFERCVHNVCQMWAHLIGPFYQNGSKLFERVTNAPCKPNVDYLTMAMLYMMKTGNVNGYIPQDVFLSQHLPREKDLPVFLKDIAHQLKPSKDLIGAFVDEAIRLRLHVEYAAFVMQHVEENNDEEKHPHPTTRGFWCKKCRHRFEQEEYFKTHEPCSLLKPLRKMKKRAIEDERVVNVKDNKATLQRRHDKQVKRVQKFERDLEKRIKKN